MSPPIRDGSGSSIGSIRLGDGSEISEVRTGAGDVLFSAGPPIPDTGLDNFYWGPQISDINTWEDAEGNNDLSKSDSASLANINNVQAVDYGDPGSHRLSGDFTFGSNSVYTLVGVFQLTDTSPQSLISNGSAAELSIDRQKNQWAPHHPGRQRVRAGSPDTNPHVFVQTFDGSNVILDIDGTEIMDVSISSPDPGGDWKIGTGFDGSDATIGAAGWEANHANATRRDELTNLLADPFGISTTA